LFWLVREYELSHSLQYIPQTRHNFYHIPSHDSTDKVAASGVRS